MFIPLLLLFMGAYFLVASYQREDKHEQGRTVAALIKELQVSYGSIPFLFLTLRRKKGKNISKGRLQT